MGHAGASDYWKKKPLQNRWSCSHRKELCSFSITVYHLEEQSDSEKEERRREKKQSKNRRETTVHHGTGWANDFRSTILATVCLVKQQCNHFCIPNIKKINSCLSDSVYASEWPLTVSQLALQARKRARAWRKEGVSPFPETERWKQVGPWKNAVVSFLETQQAATTLLGSLPQI